MQDEKASKSCDPHPHSSGMNLASWNQEDNLDEDTQDLFGDSPVKVRCDVSGLGLIGLCFCVRG